MSGIEAMAESGAPDGPLAGIRICDLASVVAGPWISALLADMGAEVVRIESPSHGDPITAFPPIVAGVPLWDRVVNRNKQRISLDLRKPAGLETLQHLLPGFDVLIENRLPEDLARLGLDDDSLHRLNPDLVIVHVTGFGQDGPYARRPSFGRSYEAMTGFAHQNGAGDGPPTHPGVPVADAVGALFGVAGIVAALVARPAKGGQVIDLSLAEAMLRIQDVAIADALTTGHDRGRNGNDAAHASPSGVFRTADDRWISIVVNSQTQFERLLTVIGRTDLLTAPECADNAARLAHRQENNRLLADWIGAHDLESCLRTLEAGKVACSPVLSPAQAARDPHFTAREALTTFEEPTLGPVVMPGAVPRFSGHRYPRSGRISAPGQDTVRVLRRSGLSQDRIDALRGEGAI